MDINLYIYGYVSWSPPFFWWILHPKISTDLNRRCSWRWWTPSTKRIRMRNGYRRRGLGLELWWNWQLGNWLIVYYSCFHTLLLQYVYLYIYIYFIIFLFIIDNVCVYIYICTYKWKGFLKWGFPKWPWGFNAHFSVDFGWCGIPLFCWKPPYGIL